MDILPELPVWISTCRQDPGLLNLGSLSIACLLQECEVPDGGQSVSFDETISTEACRFER